MPMYDWYADDCERHSMSPDDEMGHDFFWDSIYDARARPTGQPSRRSS